nr:transposase [Haemonchus contortus]
MPRSGRPPTVDRQGILDALDDEPTSSLRDLSKVTQVPRSTIHKVLIESGKVSKRRRVVPHDLTPAQARKRVEVCPDNLRVRGLRKILDSLIYQVEKWVYYSNPANKPVWVDFDALPPSREKYA